MYRNLIKISQTAGNYANFYSTDVLKMSFSKTSIQRKAKRSFKSVTEGTLPSLPPSI